MKKVLDSQATNTEVEAPNNRNSVSTLFVKGTFDGAKVIFEVSPDGGETWFSDEEDVIDKESMHNIEASSSKTIRSRIVLKDTGPSTSITAFLG